LCYFVALFCNNNIEQDLTFSKGARIVPNNFIFFHNDVDGIISASLFLHDNLGDKYQLYPVSSAQRGEKFNELFLSVNKSNGDRKIILDYQYHKDSDIWIDHHFDNEFGNYAVQNEKIIYDPKCASAAALVAQFAMKRKVCSPVFTEHHLNDVNMIDSGLFKSVNQIFKDKNPMMILRAFLEKTFPADMTFCRIVEVIANSEMNMEESLFKLKIDSSHVRDLEKNAVQIKSAIVVSKKISIVRQKRVNQFPRYSEYFVLPEIKYSLRLTPVGNNNIYFQLGFNCWQKEPNIFNIGKMLITLQDSNCITKGGGHFNVGAGMIREDLVERFIDGISIMLNEEDTMEKYAVDSTDSVEKKAAEMVKEGSAKNLNDARKIAAEQIKTPTEVVDGTKGEI
jgi:hypothetical protein